jgi:N-acylneuraminate cytidylyltransferase
MSFEVIAIIPARGGSKGILRKNLRLLAGKPLIVHTIEQALAAESVTRVVVSTDDAEIAAVARAAGAEVVHRPIALSGDTASSESAVLHVLDHLEMAEDYRPNLVVFLQCTSPIRQPHDIDRAVAVLQTEQADSLLSVVPVVSWLWRETDGQLHSFNFDYRNRLRRQERPREFNENGSIYVFKPWVLRQHNNRLGGQISYFEMTSSTNIDIETEDDLLLAELLLARLKQTGEHQR